MTIIKFKINALSFNQIIRDEMSQKINYGGKEYQFFEYVLTATVGKLESYKDWEEIDGYYYSEVEFSESMVLDKIKKLTFIDAIFRDCLVDIFMTNRQKYGYYQIQGGMTKMGFSIKDQPYFYEKLVEDSAHIENYGGEFNISMSETIKTDSNRLSKNSDEFTRKVYSLFVNDTNYESSRLNDAMILLKELFCNKSKKEETLQMV